MTLLTQNGQNQSYIEDNAKLQNLQAICEIFGGLVQGEGQAIWGQENSVTVNDTRVTPNSIVICLQPYGSQQPVGTFWTVTSRSNGSFVVTSNDVELAGTTFWYLVVNK